MAGWLSLPSEIGGMDAGRDFPLCRDGILCRHHRLYPDLREAVMGADYILAACVTVGLLSYLVYALIRPERF
jgi:K+-transporting ATPase KdpF subunit